MRRPSGALRSSSPSAAALRWASSATPRKPRPGGRAAAHGRRALPDAAGEHERVEPAERARHRARWRRAGGAGRRRARGGAGRRRRPRARAPRACRPVPASPAAPTRARAPSASSATGTPCRCASHSTSPGSTLPDRVAITRPSSGVKPIVVSTERPPRTAAQRGARAEVARDDARVRAVAPAARRRAATRRRATARGTRSGAAPPALAPRGGQRVRARRPAAASAWNAVSKQATCGHARQRAPHGVQRGERAGLVQRRELGQRARAASAPRRRRRTALAEALAAVDDAVADGVDARHARQRPRAEVGVSPPGSGAAGRARPTALVAASSSRSFRLLEPALTTRTRTPASGREPRSSSVPSPCRRRRPAQSRTSGMSSPCSRV